MKVKFMLIALILCSVNSSYAQSAAFKFQHLTPKEGLSNVHIKKTWVDKKGFLWIATQDGLNRYDGYNFSYYKHQIDDTTSLPENFINCLTEDKHGNIWIGTKEKGIAKYNYEYDNFTRYTLRHGLQSLAIQNLYCDSKGDVWASSSKGLAKYNETNEAFLPVRFDSSYYEIVYSMDELHDSILLIGTSDGGIYRYNASLKNFENIEYYQKGELKPLRIDTRVLLATQTAIWFGNYSDGLFRYDLNTKELKNYRATGKPNSIGSNEVKSLFLDSRNNLWIGCINGGASIYQPATDDFVTYQANRFDEGGLLSNSIVDLFEDENNTLWFAADLAGLSFFNFNLLLFQHYYSKPLDEKSLSDNVINSFCADSMGQIWIASANGINLFKPDHTFSSYSIPNHKNVYNDIVYFGGNKLFAAGWGSGLVEFNTKTNTFIDRSKTDSKNNKLQTLNIKGLAVDSKGLLWLAGHTLDGLHIFDAAKLEYFHALKPGDFDKRLFTIDYPVDVFIDSKQRIWIASYVGLFMFDGNFHEFYHDGNDTKTLSSNYIFTIYEDNNSDFWVGSSNGLDCLKEENGAFVIKRCRDNFNIPNNVKGILQDNEGEFWLSTNTGIVNFNSNTGILKKFDKQNGLQGNDFRERAVFKDTSGELFFGGYDGFNIFNPGEMRINEKAPQVYITEFQIFNKIQLPDNADSPLKKAIIATDKITLSYKHSVFSFEYAALSDLSKSKNLYAYKMEGFDKDWRFVGTERKATYTNLNPGTYHFKVIASNSDGVWNEKGKSIEIKILPPWWKTWVFRIFMVILVILSIRFIYLWRVRDLKQKKRDLEDEVSKRTHELQQSNEELEATVLQLKQTQSHLIQSEKIASVGILTLGIAHEINNPLNFILGGKTLIQQYIEENLPEHASQLYPSIKIIDDGIQKAAEIILVLSRFNHNNDSYNERCNLHEIIDNCLLILNNQIQYVIDVKKSYAQAENFIMGNEAELHQVILNILTNAIQSIHSKGAISISTYIECEHLVVLITDTGEGIPQENLSKIFDPFFTTKDPGKGSGMGLSIAYTIIEKHGGTIQFESQLGKGTEVILTLPIKKE